MRSSGSRIDAIAGPVPADMLNPFRTLSLRVRFFLVEPKSCFHAGDFVARRGAIASICRRPASLDLGLAFRWPISRARRQMRGDRIKCLGLRTYRTSCINATDSICRRARMESQSVVKLGQWARVDDKSNRSRSACGNATCGTFQHFRIAPPARRTTNPLRRSTTFYGIIQTFFRVSAER